MEARGRAERVRAGEVPQGRPAALPGPGSRRAHPSGSAGRNVGTRTRPLAGRPSRLDCQRVPGLKFKCPGRGLGGFARRTRGNRVPSVHLRGPARPVQPLTPRRRARWRRGAPNGGRAGRAGRRGAGGEARRTLLCFTTLVLCRRRAWDDPEVSGSRT